MTCDTARILLALRRPTGNGEFAPEDAAELEQHLAGCADCSRVAAAAVAFDQSVRQAMTSVPRNLVAKQNLLTQLTTREAVRFRYSLYARAAIVVLAVLLGGIGYGIVRAARPGFDTDGLVWQLDQHLQDPELAVRSWLEGEQLPPELPAPFDYRKCKSFGRFPLQGGSVPGIEFRYYDLQSGREEIARVYIVSDTEFQLHGLTPAQSSYFVAEVLHDDRANSGLVYIVAYTHSPEGLRRFLRTDHANFG